MFKTHRYDLITSIVGILAVVFLLVVYRNLSWHMLIDHETRSHTNFAQVFSNTIWPRYDSFLIDASRFSKAELQRHEVIHQLHRDLTRYIARSSVVQVKIQDLTGITVFSTDPAQIGQDNSGDSGFISARKGVPIGKITFRHRFDTFAGAIIDRNLASSYIPVRISDHAPVEAVMEVYSDVTDLVIELKTRQRRITLGVLGGLSLVYLFLFVIIRQADKAAHKEDKERMDLEPKIRY